MAHAGLPIDVDWRSQDAVAIGKVAQVVSSKLILHELYLTTHREGEY
jgi:hypothetical protein